jgi:hypothetical protein
MGHFSDRKITYSGEGPMHNEVARVGLSFFAWSSVVHVGLSFMQLNGPRESFLLLHAAQVLSH